MHDKDEKCPQERKITRSRARHKGEGINMDLKETGFETVDWFHLAQDMVRWWVPMNQY
jgi:hypothetical protein